MKLSFILSVLVVFQVSAASYAQKVSLHVNSASIDEVFYKLTQQTGYTFTADSELIKALKPVSLKLENVELSEVLNKCFGELPVDISYNKKDKIVVVRKIIKKAATPIQPPLTIRGRITDQQGNPLPGTRVNVKNEEHTTVTDINGNYTLMVPSQEAILVFSFIGFENREVKVGKQRTIDMEMVATKQDLDEVVVTALGIEREKKALGYSVQQIEGEALTQVPSPNLMQSLTGKVAGLTVFNQLGTFDAPRINIRGSNDILIIVDGVPGFDSWAINPEDIESVDVIKGATGAALYGAQGTNGVIMITTKKGAGGKQGVSIDVSSNTTFQAGYLIIPEFQTRYGQGMNGQYSYVDGMGSGVFDNQFQSWGPELNVNDPTTASGYVEIPQYNSPRDPDTGELIPLPWITRSENPIKDFLKPSLTTSNTFSIGGNNDLGNFRISANQTYKEGQAPNTNLFNNYVHFSGGYKFHEKITVDASVSYNKLYSDNYETANYNWQNYMLIIGHDFPANVGMEDLKDYWVAGQEGYKQKTWMENRNNPYWQLNERTQKYGRDKLVGWISGHVEFTPNLKLMGRINLAHTSYNTEYRENIGNNMIGSNGTGAFSKDMRSNIDMNTDFLLSYDKRIIHDDIGIDISVGGSSRTLENDNMISGIAALVVPGLYNLSNRQGEYSSTNNYSKKIVNSLYSSGTIDYKRAVYFTATARNDWSSALSLNNNSYFYPSFSLSTLPKEYLKLPDLISFIKLRGSWARGRQDISPYWNSSVYAINSWTTSNIPMADFPNLLYSNDLKAQQLDTYEIGGDIRFLNNRLGIDVTYYHKSLTDMITTVPLSRASGFANRQINGREIITKGYEFAVSGMPVQTDYFSWNAQVNMGLWKDYLGKLAPGETKYQGFYREGERIGTWRGRVFQRSPDGDIIYEAGLPLWEDEPQRGGFLDPDLTFGFINTFRYKNWNATIQLDGRIGGYMYNYQYSTMMFRGTNKDSAIGDIREKPWVGNGVKVVSGEAIRDAYGNIIYDNRVFEKNDVPVNYFDWVNRYYTGVYEVNMYDNTFVKLREINIGYNLSNDWLRTKLKVNNVYLAAIGYNLWVYSRIPYSDPDRGEADNGQGPSPRMLGFNIKVNF